MIYDWIKLAESGGIVSPVGSGLRIGPPLALSSTTCITPPTSLLEFKKMQHYQFSTAATRFFLMLAWMNICNFMPT